MQHVHVQHVRMRIFMCSVCVRAFIIHILFGFKVDYGPAKARSRSAGCGAPRRAARRLSPGHIGAVISMESMSESEKSRRPEEHNTQHTKERAARTRLFMVESGRFIKEHITAPVPARLIGSRGGKPAPMHVRPNKHVGIK